MAGRRGLRLRSGVRAGAVAVLAVLVGAVAAAGEPPGAGLPTRSALDQGASVAHSASPVASARPAATTPPPPPSGPTPQDPVGQESAITVPETFEGPPAPAGPLGGLDDRPSGRPGVYGVFIGIDDYPGSDADLRYAVDDAEAADLAVGSFGVPPSNRLVVRDGQADRPTVRAALDWLVARAGPGSVAVLFYAGHVRDLGGGHEALVVAEGADLRDDELAAALAPLRAERSWVVIAGCYGGGFDELRAPGRVLTAAAPAGALAYENSSIGGSYLVHYLFRRGWLDRLAGPSVQEAFRFAVTAIGPDRQPVQYDDLGSPLRLDQVSFEQRAPVVAAPPPIQVARPSGGCLLGLCG